MSTLETDPETAGPKFTHESDVTHARGDPTDM
jgi:hypothetical protein